MSGRSRLSSNKVKSNNNKWIEEKSNDLNNYNNTSTQNTPTTTTTTTTSTISLNSKKEPRIGILSREPLTNTGRAMQRFISCGITKQLTITPDICLYFV